MINYNEQYNAKKYKYATKSKSNNIFGFGLVSSLKHLYDSVKSLQR